MSHADPPTTVAVQAGAEIERTASDAANAEQHHPRIQPVGDEEKQRLDSVLTTDAEAQDSDSVVNPESS